MSSPEKGIFQTGENQELLKSIEIPANEIECLNSIKSFIGNISEKEFNDFDGAIGYPVGTNQRIKNLLEEKKAEIEKRDDSFTEDDKLYTLVKERARAQYEICRDVLEYQKDQLQKLTDFIESQNIWKSKFTTASNVNYYHWSDNPIEDFKESLAKSEELHAEISFAQLSRNSIYYISKAGISLRIKLDAMYGDGSIREALQDPMELILFIDDISDRDNYKAPSYKGKSIYPKKSISFEPKITCRVEEFSTKDFQEHTLGTFISPIKVYEENENFIVKDYNISHGGHYINKIYF